MNPLQSQALDIICEQLGVSDLERADKAIAQQAYAIALNFAIQTQLLSASSMWNQSTRSERDALGGELNLTLAQNGAFEVFGKSDT